MFDLWQIFLFASLLLMGAVFAYAAFNHFEIAIGAVAFSPWISAIFTPNAPLLAAQEASLGSYLRIGLLVVVGALGVLKYLQNWPLHQGKLSPPFAFLGVFLVLALLSTFYSIDQKFTFVRSASFLAVFGFMLGFDVWLKRKKNVDQVLNILFYLVSFFVLASLAALLFWPAKAWLWNAPNRFQGIWNHPNTMGSFCMISYPILLWKHGHTSSQGKWMVISLLLVSVFLHVLTGSRGSLLASLVGISIWFISQKKHVKLFLYLGTAGFLFLVLILVNPSRFERKEKPKSLTYLTGRTEFWKAAFILVKENPILGYGYDVEGKVWQDPRFHNPKLTLWSVSARTSLHNGYISIAIGVGMIGFLIWCIVLFYPYGQLFKLKASEYKGFVLSVFTMVILLNLIETTITGGQSLASVVFWIAWVMGGKKPQIFSSA